MSMQSEGRNAQGRNYDQVTKDGSSSAATLGAGGTGDVGRMSGRAGTSTQGGGAGNRQQGGRTDDLLSSDAELDRDSNGYVSEEAGQLQTGLGGIGSKLPESAGRRTRA